MVVKYETVVGQDIGGGITRRILAHNGNMMIVEAVFKKGAVGTAHRHPLRPSGRLHCSTV